MRFVFVLKRDSRLSTCARMQSHSPLKLTFSSVKVLQIHSVHTESLVKGVESYYTYRDGSLSISFIYRASYLPFCKNFFT